MLGTFGHVTKTDGILGLYSGVRSILVDLKEREIERERRERESPLLTQHVAIGRALATDDVFHRPIRHI
jgi:hypothetical protein